MSGVNEQWLFSPTGARDGARRVHAVGADSVAPIEALLATIRSLHAARPWGTDRIGNDFLAKYMPDGKPFGETPAGKLMSSATKVGEVLSSTGRAVDEYVAGTINGDEALKRMIDSLK